MSDLEPAQEVENPSSTLPTGKVEVVNASEAAAAANVPDQDELAYADVAVEEQQQQRSMSSGEKRAVVNADGQDSYFESKEPAEMILCLMLAAAYAGLAKFCWLPLESAGDLFRFVTVEGFFITPALLCIVLAVRPYVSPSNLQISTQGLKYRGPYWPQRRTVNWHQIFRLYLSEELVIVVYHPPSKPSGAAFLFIQSNYLSERKAIVESIAKYALVRPVYLKNPDWYIKLVLLIAYMSAVCWILFMLRG